MQNMALLANDGSNPRGLYGWNKAMGLWGFFLTKIGVDVTTNTDPSQFIFNSNQDVFKIAQSGTAVIPSSATATSQVTVTHGLGFVPMAICGLDLLGDGTNIITMPFTTVNSSTGAILADYRIIQVTSTTIIFRATVPGSTVSGGSIVRYYLLQETAN